MGTYIALTVLTTLLAALAAHAQPATLTLAEFKADRAELRQKAKRIKARKCLPPPHPFGKWARHVRPAWRDENVRYWRRIVDRARARASRCEVARALAWYRTSGAACVKAHEGAWTSNTGNGYWGGFQADLSFQVTYGAEFYRRWGTANYWPPYAQIVMAYRGWLARGFAPWPTTRRICGV